MVKWKVDKNTRTNKFVVNMLTDVLKYKKYDHIQQRLEELESEDDNG